MAAVAVAGVASAQVTITGGIAYGWQSSTESVSAYGGTFIDANGAVQPGTAGAGEIQLLPAVTGGDRVERAGFGVDTASVTFAANEDLGGGMSVSGSMTIGGINRSSLITGENYAMTLNAGSMGSFSFQNVEIGSGIRDIGSAGAPVNNMEGEILGAAGNGNIAKYTFPAMIDGVALSVNHVSSNTGMGMGDSNGDATSNGIAVDYAAGALTAKVDYTNYQVNSAGYTSKTRVAASYDMGMATVGFGNESNAAADAADADKYTIIGLSSPVGSNMTVGVVRVTKKIGTTASLAGTSYGLKYNLSKRTNLSASVSNWDASSTVRSDKTTVVLSHAF
ncbi:MAG: porin [Pseudomonas sp.]|nr:porin [Pseudomonas sp.]